MRPIRTLLVVANSAENATLSYQHGWPRALAADGRFEIALVNVLDRRGRARLRLRPPRTDLVILLHSVFSNECHLRGDLLERVARLAARKVYFVGNEYKLMPEKIDFCETLGIDLVVSQLSSAEAHRLYADRLGCAVVGIPNTGFDPAVFAPSVPPAQRPVELGYRAFPGPLYLGHREREELVEAFEAAAPRLGLTLDVSLDPADRLTEVQWAAFLNRCRGQLGSEAGGDYFELTDETRVRVNEFTAANPDAGIAEVRRRFFDGYARPVSGRALSGRIVEAAATKTTQLLIEGEYGGLFHAGVHYIPLRRDLANLDEAVAEFRDEAHAARIAEAAHALAHAELTYARLIDRLYAAVSALLA